MRRSVIRISLAVGLVVALGATPGSTQAPAGADSGAVLAAADRVRVPQQPFRMTVTLTEFVRGKAKDRIILTVFSRLESGSGEFRTLVKYVQPPRDAGKLVLFNGTNLWFFDPSSKASVRISPQQRLIGQAANGDVVTTNLATDYAGRQIADESIKDADGVLKECWRIDAVPKRPVAVYGRIEYWIERGTSRPVKAKFYADSGRLLKIAYYRGYGVALGQTRPLETVIIDAIDANLVTVMNTRDYVAQSVPEIWFQRDYLPQVR
jgi:hypothetical protein